MRATSVKRLVIHGAVGFGVAWALLGVFGGGLPLAGGVGLVLGGAVFSGDLPALLLYTSVLSLGGARGGAVLGLASKDFRRAAILAVLGGAGFFVGSFIVVSLFLYLAFVRQAAYGSLEAPSAQALGLVVCAVLSLPIRSVRGTVVLASASLVGFGLGGVPAAAVQGFPLQPSGSFPSSRSAAFGAVEGTIGGASLGAALGYLENRMLVEERSERMR
jgi:hypothetical protein